MFRRAAALSRVRTPLLVVAWVAACISFAACTPPSGHSAPSAAPPRPSRSFPRAECNGPWLDAYAQLALPADDAARARLWDALAPEPLPPPFRECASGGPQTDMPENDFGLAPYSQPAPVEQLEPPTGWAAERPELSALLLPAVQSLEESWHRGEGSHEHAFTTAHWLGPIRPETLASFDRAARGAGLRLGAVMRRSLAFTLRYASEGARLDLSRASRTEVVLELGLTTPGELRHDPAVAAAIAARPLASRLAERVTLRSARHRGSRFDFVFALDGRRRGEDELARERLAPAKCPARRSKGSDPRRCYATSDGRALVVVKEMSVAVLDEPHDAFE